MSGSHTPDRYRLAREPSEQVSIGREEAFEQFRKALTDAVGHPVLVHEIGSPETFAALQ